ncbi:MAG: hypothetical protein AAGA90_20045 [Actinomycetota bacterium]
MTTTTAPPVPEFMVLDEGRLTGRIDVRLSVNAEGGPVVHWRAWYAGADRPDDAVVLNGVDVDVDLTSEPGRHLGGFFTRGSTRRTGSLERVESKGADRLRDWCSRQAARLFDEHGIGAFFDAWVAHTAPRSASNLDAGIERRVEALVIMREYRRIELELALGHLTVHPTDQETREKRVRVTLPKPCPDEMNVHDAGQPTNRIAEVVDQDGVRWGWVVAARHSFGREVLVTAPHFYVTPNE